MNPAELLRSLQEEGIQLWCEGERLRYRAPQGRLGPELIQTLSTHKSEIVALLRKPPAFASCFQAWAPPEVIRDYHPLSFAQQRMWFLKQLEPDSCALNVAMGFSLAGPLDISALERGLSELIDRHEAFRTTCAAKDGHLVQMIAPPGSSDMFLNITDLRSTPDAERESELKRLINLKARQPFALDRPPLLHAALFRLAENDHALLLTTHHFVVDGWSVGVFLRDLSALYDANSSGHRSSLGKLATRYSDYAVWQRQHLKGSVREELLVYWRGKLDGAVELNLPTDRPAPASPSGQGATHLFDLPADLSDALKALSRREGVTLFMTLLTVFKALLHRYSRQSDIVVGTAVSDRCIVETQALVGCFANTLVLRTMFDGNPTFRQMLRRVHDTAIDAFDHQDMPFEVLVEHLRPERLQLRNPLFQVSFLLHQHADDQGLKLNNLAIRQLHVDLGTSRFDLLLEFNDQRERLAGLLEYSTDLFDTETIRRMAENYRTLLEGVVADPGQRVSDLQLLASVEQHKILVEWNDTAADYARDKCFDALFEAQVRRTPETVAVCFEDRALTYRELDKRADELAVNLRGMGVGPEILVGICMQRSIDMLVALLGILKAGGAYVPLDPTYPKERLAHILEDARPQAVLTERALRGELLAGQPNVIHFEELQESMDIGARNAIQFRSSSNLAYVIYTSGSTGKPKGVEISHRALVNFLTSMLRTPGLNANDTLLAVTTLAFDIAGLELFLPLMSGARVVIAGNEQARDGGQLLALMQRSGATVMQATPATWRMLLEAGWQGDPRLKILCGGEAWPRELAEDLLKRCGSLWNMYGPTETTIWSAVAKVEAGQPVAVGPPIANTSFYILDECRRPMPIGAPGELYIGGDGVARGYHNRPDLTAEKFVSDPFRSQSAGRLYRTGDLARYRSDGTIDYLGRMDNQVKIRGFRIELGEIESVIGQFAGVRQAVAAVFDGVTGDKRLVAYVVPDDDRTLLPVEALRGQLKLQLPDYMIPSAFVVLDKLPLTPNGKVDRRALIPPERQVDGYRAPRSPQEEILCTAFADVLCLDRVGIDDNFFSLGGHSLLAMQLVSRVRALLGAELAVRAVFEAPTVSDLVACLGGAGKAPAPLARLQRPSRLPVSYAQERFWFLDRLEGSRAEFKINEALRLRGELDLQALERAINALVERHEVLRTHFREAGGEPFQVVEPTGRISLSKEDLTARDEEAVQAALRRQARVPMALSQDPLLRIGLLKLGPCDHILHWSWHHIVTDAWSIAVFKKELAALYTAFREGRLPDLPELAIQYPDYAIWQRAHLKGETLAGLLDYWRHQLRGSCVLELPIDRPRGDVQTHAGATEALVFPKGLANQLRELSRRENSTVFMTLLAALKVLLFRYTGQEDVSVGIPIANRGHVEVENLIGCLLNTLVVRTQLSSDARFRDFLLRVREVTLEAYAHQELPFEKLLEELQPERNLNRTPLFQVFINYTSFEADAMNLPGLSVESLGYSEIEARFDLSLYFTDIEKHLRLDLVYNSDLFEASTIQRMLERFKILLEAIVADPDQKIGALALLTPDDRKTHTISDNRVRPVNPYVHFPLSGIEQSLGSRFEEQARNHSTHTAVKTQRHEWTYAELDRRANMVAREMLRLSPEGDQRAALLLDHDAPMVAAILGSLKAGKTYVPLSPSHPSERIASIIADSQPRLLVTDAANRERAREFAVGEIQLIDIEALSDDSEPVLHHVDLSPDALAYVLYTSGSTGEPKGIAQSHRNVLHHIRNYTNGLHISPHDRMLLLASYGFDAAVMDIFGALLNGATLLPFDIRKHDFISLSGWVATEHITIYHSTPTVFRHFLRAIPENGAFGATRLVLMGGEPVLSQDLDLFKKRFSSRCLIVNGFGQTEYSFSLQYFADSETEFVGNSIPIGYPVDETAVSLLDDKGHAGQIFGEITIRSRYLAQGYWGRPELTAAAFKEDPDGEKMTFRTGDLGRLRVDGTVEFAGRKDFQVKIRGNRVELGEIETVLHRHSQIDGVVVVVRHSAENEEQLVAYVVLKNGGSASGDQLRDFLAKSLPDYMVPSTFVMLDKMPLTPNGKIDRTALSLPERERSDLPYLPPRTPFERSLVDIWRDVLGLDAISVRDDFFEQGGHSLIATRLVSQIREKLDVEIPIRAVFEKRTIENLALYIAELEAGAAAPDEIEKLLEELESLP
ncbi:MAG TPA: amino acid adenylation domain-containing protein [Terrimicrobiaceae bacterium]